MNALGVPAVEVAWFAHIEAGPSPSRWIWCSTTSRPIRQVPTTTKNAIWELVSFENGHWWVNRGGKMDKILLVGHFINVFIAEWASRPNFRHVREWGDKFAKSYSGVMRKDVEFLVRIQTTGRLPPTPGTPPAPIAAIAPIEVEAAVEVEVAVENEICLSTSDSKPSRTPLNPPPSYTIFKEAASEQEALFNDPRRFALLDNHEEVINAMAGKKMQEETHLERLSQNALYIFENGRPAMPWTVGMPEILMKEKDYLLLTEDQHVEMSARGILEFPVVVRDQGFRKRRTCTSRDEFFRMLRLLPNKRVHVQDLGLPVMSPSALVADCLDVTSRWQQPATTFSTQNPPLNLLNITDKSAGVTPLAISKEYKVLADACTYSWGDHIGKQPLETTAADFTNCMQFRILAQRGAVSGFHIDNCGVTTWVTLEPLSDNGEADTDCVKYWFIIPTHRLDDEEKAKVLKDFGKYGSDWKPELSCKIPSITLITGDTLIMPPGTIHAPITMTDCFFVGGMCMHPKSLKNTMATWQYLSRHQDCSNELAPAQARAVLDYIYHLVHDSPATHGYIDDQLGDFDRMCEEISKKIGLKCDCTTGCSNSKRCKCLSVGQRCGPKCHQGTSCQNPCGQHRSYLSRP